MRTIPTLAALAMVVGALFFSSSAHAGGTESLYRPALAYPPAPAPAQQAWRRYRFRVELEAGPVWQTRNDARVPGTTGTDVDIADLTGNGPFPYGRITFDGRVARKHGIRALVAPLEISGTGQLPGPTRFNGQLFAPGIPTKATYRFNSYRLSYRYFLVDRPRWTATVGVTVKIRDALTKLEQFGQSSKKTDLGVVPLLHLDTTWRFADRWSLYADLDGWAVPQGRAFDFSVKLYYDLSARWSLGVGYRMIEGGADVDSVYTFAWFHQGVVALSFRF